MECPKGFERCSAEVEELFLLVIQDHHAQSLMDDLVSWRLKSIF